MKIATISINDTNYTSGDFENKYKDVDVLCVQNLTNTTVLQHLKNEGFNDTYVSPRKEGGWEAILSKLPISKKGYSSFSRTKENRGILWVKIGDVYVVTSTLESGGEGNIIRKSQIDELVKTFSDKCVFAGDTNIPSWLKFDISDMFMDWSDAWMERGTSYNEYTNGDSRSYRFWFTSKIECLSFEKRGDMIVSSFS